MSPASDEGAAFDGAAAPDAAANEDGLEPPADDDEAAPPPPTTIPDPASSRRVTSRRAAEELEDPSPSRVLLLADDEDAAMQCIPSRDRTERSLPGRTNPAELLWRSRKDGGGDGRAAGGFAPAASLLNRPLMRGPTYAPP